MKRHMAFALIALALCLTGCGGGGGSEGETATDAQQPRSDQEAIEWLVADYVAAIKGGHSDAVCDLQTEAFSERMASEFQDVMQRPATCEEVIETLTVPGNSGPDTISNVDVAGSSATGKVGSDEWRFVRVDGTWKVDYAD